MLVLLLLDLMEKLESGLDFRAGLSDLLSFQGFQSDANFSRFPDNGILVDPPERLCLLNTLATPLSQLQIVFIILHYVTALFFLFY